MTKNKKEEKKKAWVSIAEMSHFHPFRSRVKERASFQGGRPTIDIRHLFFFCMIRIQEIEKNKSDSREQGVYYAMSQAYGAPCCCEYQSMSHYISYVASSISSVGPFVPQASQVSHGENGPCWA